MIKARKTILLSVFAALAVSTCAPVYAEINGKTVAGAALFISLFLLFRKKSDPHFTENAHARFNNSHNIFQLAWHFYNDVIIGQLEKDALLKITDKKNIKLGSSKEADAAGILGIFCTEVEPLVDASKNLLFIAALYTFATGNMYQMPSLKEVVKSMKGR
jgi:hypothetical protein